MIVAEYRSDVSTVRIHDEHCEKKADRLMPCLNYVVSQSYKRRQMEGGFGHIAAMQSEASKSRKTLL